MKWLGLICSLLSSLAVADPLEGGIELGTSVSHFYDGRSIFTNPAALGYQTELNGGAFLPSLSIATNQNQPTEYSFGLGLGVLGFGFERFIQPDVRNRYSLGIGLPLGNAFFAGVRYTFVRPDLGGGYDSLDLGFQMRPSRYWSLGVMGTHLNRPTDPSLILTPKFILGLTLRPFSRLTIGFDVDTPYDRFGSSLAYQTTASFAVDDRLELSIGYHSVYAFMGGVKVNLGQAAGLVSFQPNSSTRKVFASLQMSSHPYPGAAIPRTTLKLKIDGELTDGPTRAGFFGGYRPTLLGLLETLKAAENQGHISTVLIELQAFPLGSACAQEVFEALSRLREKGKTVVVHLGDTDQREFLIASAANKIVIDDNASIIFTGFQSQQYFLKGTLNKVGIEAEMLARGEYKSAPEMFNRTEPSAANREMTLALMRDAEIHFISLMSRYRKIDKKKWDEILKHAMYSADDAVKAGLVDEKSTFRKTEETVSKMSMFATDLESRRNDLALPSLIAVIVAEGDITKSRGGLMGFAGSHGITPENVARKLKVALANPRTKAVVLRVDSPGGEVLPSDQIAEMIEETKKTHPVFVSMGDVAASGGYMISAPATKIFASPLTITGSIGVFLGKPNLKELYKKIELNKEVITDAPYPNLMSEHRPWSPAERDVMLRRMNQYYEGFVGFVAKSRGITPDVAEKSAKGRVWTGSQAAERKLVDFQGGYRETIAAAAKEVGLSEDEFQPWLLPDDGNFLQLLRSDLIGVDSGQQILSLLSPQMRREIVWMAHLQESPFLFLAPIDEEAIP